MITASGTWVRFVIQLATVVLVARLLGPEQYGFAAIVLVYAAGAELLRVSGLSLVVVQRASLPQAVVSSLHYLSISAGLLITVVLVAAGPWLAAVLSVPGHTSELTLLAILFALASSAAVPAALLARNLVFGRLAAVELMAALAGSGGAIALSVAGAGRTALVVQALVFALLQCGGTLLSCPWRPGRPAPWHDVCEHMGFAANVSAVQLLNYVTRSFDKILVGAFAGPAAAGLYTQASQLLVLPLEQVSGPLQRVAIPAFSRVHASRDRFRRSYRTVVTVVGYVLWPTFVTLAVLADGIVRVLFGPAWAEAASLFRILAIAGFGQTLGYVTSWVFVATDQVSRQSAWAFASRPIQLFSLLAGVPWGVRGMALAYALTSVGMVLPAFLLARARAGLRVMDLFAPVLWPGVVALTVAASLTTARGIVDPAAGPLSLLVNLAVAALAAGTCAVLLPPVRADIASITALLHRRSPAAATTTVGKET
ncbi:lipopolysaccharide biosynthesis protein [Streptomyces sp. TRM66268-LWL]|uniref:Lipopolysaccharide biosynthesis protein n=1 Tax=Streptomyces polyasparticus TaxID=2767826 RepID=A0ABR7SXY0_9ACTN|nr:lipopolysaccharide biosynthesis protein [Streptomyces polyasparticus]